MDVGFAGTPAFAAEILAALLDAGFSVPLVLTQPDRPRGRGQKVEASPVKRLALARGLPVRQPSTLRSAAERTPLVGTRLDVLAVAAYGLILPTEVLAWPRHGCVNVHASLLPRWRGAAPVQRALLAGDAETGVTIMQMDAGLDTGPMLAVARVGVDARETRATLERKLAVEGAHALVRVLRALAAGAAPPATPQPAAGATYAAKVDKAEARIDWRASAIAIDRQVRAFDPAPGAQTTFDDEGVKIWRAEPARAEAAQAVPGTVVACDATAILVACGEGTLRIAELQPAGGRRMPAAAFVAGRRVVPGAHFGTPAA